MIIWGTRTSPSQSGSGKFNCPRCNTKKNYVYYDVKRWFTLYFIPIIPLGTAGEYIECGGCASTWSPEVLRFDPAQEQHEAAQKAEQKAEREFDRVLRRVMVMMVLADGNIDQREIQMVQEAYEKATGRPLTESQVKNEIRASDGDVDVARFLKKAGVTLNVDGKRALMRCAIAIANADGSVSPEEKKLLLDMSKALDLTKAQLEEIVGGH